MARNEWHYPGLLILSVEVDVLPLEKYLLRLKIHPKGMAITIPSALVFFGEKKDFQGCAGIDISNVFDQSC